LARRLANAKPLAGSFQDHGNRPMTQASPRAAAHTNRF
jgi:hypothetical protein